MDKTIIEELGLDDGLIVYDAKRLQTVLHCGRKQAYEIMRSAGFPSIRLNTKLIVTKEKLDEWIDNNSYGTYSY